VGDSVIGAIGSAVTGRGVGAARVGDSVIGAVGSAVTGRGVGAASMLTFLRL